jgi:hypothetical protein
MSSPNPRSGKVSRANFALIAALVLVLLALLALRLWPELGWSLAGPF